MGPGLKAPLYHSFIHSFIQSPFIAAEPNNARFPSFSPSAARHKLLKSKQHTNMGRENGNGLLGARVGSFQQIVAALYSTAAQ